MSYSLVRASLDLVDNESPVNQDNKKKRSKRLNGAINLIPAHQRISQNRRLQSRSRKINYHDSKKSTKNLNDAVEDNVQRLIQLSKSKLDPETADKLLNRAVKSENPVARSMKKREESTVFTEEDFRRFEAEYIDQ